MQPDGKGSNNIIQREQILAMDFPSEMGRAILSFHSSFKVSDVCEKLASNTGITTFPAWIVKSFMESMRHNMTWTSLSEGSEEMQTRYGILLALTTPGSDRYNRQWEDYTIEMPPLQKRTKKILPGKRWVWEEEEKEVPTAAKTVTVTFHDSVWRGDKDGMVEETLTEKSTRQTMHKKARKASKETEDKMRKPDEEEEQKTGRVKRTRKSSTK